MKSSLLTLVVTTVVLLSVACCASAAPQPVRKFWYVLGEAGDSHIYQFVQDAAGHLEFLSPASVPIGTKSYSFATTPDGRFLYTASGTTGDVLQFKVATDGQLIALKPSSVPGDCFWRMLVSSNGKFLYCIPANSTGVDIYKVLSDGRLSKLPHVVKTDNIPINMTFDPSGRFAYIVCLVALDPPSGNRMIDQYRVNEDGTLTALKPFSFWEGAGGGDSPFSRAGHPYIYVPDSEGLAQYTITANGQLVKPIHSIMNKSSSQAFATVDEPYNLIFGTAGGDIVPYRQPDSIAITRINPDNTLTVVTEYHVDFNGYLDQVVPGPRQTANQDNDIRVGGSDIDPNAALDSLAVDADKQMLYVIDGSTFRTFRYKIRQDGTLHLIVPYVYMGWPTSRHAIDNDPDFYFTSTQPYILSVTAK